MSARILLLLTAALWTTLAAPNAAASLQDNTLFEIRASMNKPELVVPRQNVKLEIETATSGWFTSGTRIKLPEVPGLIILQREKFAANASERRGESTWVIQRWTLDVYPLKPGTFTIPPIAVSAGLTDSTRKVVEGTAYTTPLSLTVSLPDSLKGSEDWVASSRFTVSQVFDKPLDARGVGDAIEQRIEIESTDVPAMMLPVAPVPQIDGLAVYAQPPQLVSQNNRGVATAKRTTRISYVVEEPGEFVLPAQDYFWWNTNTGELEVITLPAVTVMAGGVTKGAGADNWQSAAAAILGVIGLLLFIVVAGVLLLKAGKSNALARLVSHPFWARRLAAWRRLIRPALPDRLNP